MWVNYLHIYVVSCDDKPCSYNSVLISIVVETEQQGFVQLAPVMQHFVHSKYMC